MNFAKIAKELREESGLSQMQLSKQLGISAAAIGFLELDKHEPNSATIIAYSKFFKVSADFLLGIEDDSENIVIKKEAPQLSAEELEIIENYRELNPSGKKLIKQTFETLNHNNIQASKIKKGLGERPTYE